LQSHPVPFRDDITATFPVATTVYKNTDSRPKLINITGGTITSISRSRDNSVYDLCPGTAGEYLMAPGDYLKVIVTNVTGLAVIAYPQ
jgi:hypothetical protein